MSENIKSSKSKLTEGAQRYLAFTLGVENYAMPLLAVKEVIAMPEITPIPQSPAHFLGIMNLRGQIISIIDMRLKFGLKADRTAETVVIICDLAPLCLGIVVNRVDSVLTLTEGDINPRPEVQGHKMSAYIEGVTKHHNNLVLLLDIARALDVADRQAMVAAQKPAA